MVGLRMETLFGKQSAFDNFLRVTKISAIET